MIDSRKFLKLVLDSVTDPIVVINRRGRILHINRSWTEFDSGQVGVSGLAIGDNYLEACDEAAAAGDEFGFNAVKVIKSVIDGECDEFYYEYACHGIDEKRWMKMSVTFFRQENTRCFFITHQDITERKQAEDEIANLSRTDGLTGLASRSSFNEFIDNEWNRCARLKLPVSLAIVDIDNFKLLNDTYGYAVGDACLKQVAQVLKQYTKRPADICARYSDEKFALVLGGTSVEQSRDLIGGLNAEIQALMLPDKKLPPESVLTVSVGLATMSPDVNNKAYELINKADMLLFVAKDNGRNRIAS